MKIRHIYKKIVSCIQKSEFADTPIELMIRDFVVNVPNLIKYKVSKNPKPGKKEKHEKQKEFKISKNKKQLKKLSSRFNKIFSGAIQADKSLKKSVKELQKYLLKDAKRKHKDFDNFLKDLEKYFEILLYKPKKIQLIAFNIFPKGAAGACVPGDWGRLTDALLTVTGAYPYRLLKGCVDTQIPRFRNKVPGYNEVHIGPVLLILCGG
ncbi:hypothetical protein ACFLZV_03555 [Candidatus Margulisiibacteriota bacterium]